MELVRRYMSLPERSKRNSFYEVYQRLLESLRNRRGMLNSIGDIGNLEIVFYGFDHQKTLQAYSCNWEKLFDAIRIKTKPKSKMDKNNAHNYWVIFCKGSISAADYLSRFNTLDEFLGFIDDFDEKPNTRPALPLLMGEEIFGYGFALACDFLKEIGFSNYSKPDTHLIHIFSGLGISEKSQLDVFKMVSLLSDEVGQTPYAIDKVFWLIGSGNLYLHNVKFKTSKTEFIELVKTNWGKR
jgi:hypothetical protein